MNRFGEEREHLEVPVRPAFDDLHLHPVVLVLVENRVPNGGAAARHAERFAKLVLATEKLELACLLGFADLACEDDGLREQVRTEGAERRGRASETKTHVVDERISLSAREVDRWELSEEVGGSEDGRDAVV